MGRGKPRDAGLEQQWRQRIARWQRSGLSVQAFCARYALSAPSFYAWRRELRRRQAATVRVVPVRVVPDEEPAAAGAVELILAGERRLRVAPGFDTVTLQRLLAVLEEARPC